MNNRGQVVFYAAMVGLTVIILALAMAPAIASFNNTTMTSMDCSNDSISNFYKASCTVVDIGGFYFIASMILIGGAFITMRIIF